MFKDWIVPQELTELSRNVFSISKCCRRGWAGGNASSFQGRKEWDLRLRNTFQPHLKKDSIKIGENHLLSGSASSKRCFIFSLFLPYLKSWIAAYFCVIQSNALGKAGIRVRAVGLQRDSGHQYSLGWGSSPYTLGFRFRWKEMCLLCMQKVFLTSLE